VNLLLDTHALLWWFLGDRRLAPLARQLIANDDNEVFVSAASAWEIATKVRNGKLPGALNLVYNFTIELATDGFRMLDISFAHALKAGSLRTTHKDPFDRMLIAQAMIENYILVSNEEIFDGLGVARIWT
jgi:PIN domain nuclease of toxin-antitoxin system